MKIISFNVNGIRAITAKTFVQDMQHLNPDIFCLQETKATVEQVKEALAALTDYEIFANEAERKGYSGTAIATKQKPLNVTYDMGMEEHDREGRVICAEFETFFVVTVYVPNSGSELARLPYRQTWDSDFLEYLQGLESSKPVVVCG
ncbi:MAG: exodeoxyribonuclease III, partial [Bacteroidota bacterium]